MNIPFVDDTPNIAISPGRYFCYIWLMFRNEEDLDAIIAKITVFVLIAGLVFAGWMGWI